MRRQQRKQQGRVLTVARVTMGVNDLSQQVREGEHLRDISFQFPSAP